MFRFVGDGAFRTSEQTSSHATTLISYCANPMVLGMWDEFVPSPFEAWEMELAAIRTALFVLDKGRALSLLRGLDTPCPKAFKG